VCDADVLAVLVREPFAGVTPAVYAGLSDWQIAEVYLAPRDDDHQLTAYRRRHRRPEDGPTGRPEDAGRELKSAEELGVPGECFFQGPGRAYVLMFWQVWRGRGLSVEQTLGRWQAQLKRCPPARTG
jgi:hypothetical protein